MDIVFNSYLAALISMAAVFTICYIVFDVLKKAYNSFQERYVSKSSKELSDMFLFIDDRQLLLLSFAVTVLFLLIGFLLLGTFFTIIIGALGFFVPSLTVRILKKRRIKRFNVQLVDALNAMANAFKAGLTFPQAMETVAQESAPPLSQEFLLFVREVKLNVSLEQALKNMAARVGSEDLDLVVTSINIARQLGGNMAEMFDTIAATIRERFRLEGRIAALTAQGKLQGWVVAFLPLALGLVLNWMRPDLMQPMFDNAYGYVLMGLILFMEALGILMIRKIVNINV
jgi:tight adherence protein B